MDEDRKSEKDRMPIPQSDMVTDPELPHAETPANRRSGRARALLLGAYTFLFVWGMAYLVLFFTDRLPT